MSRQGSFAGTTSSNQSSQNQFTPLSRNVTGSLSFQGESGASNPPARPRVTSKDDSFITDNKFRQLRGGASRGGTAGSFNLGNTESHNNFVGDMNGADDDGIFIDRTRQEQLIASKLIPVDMAAVQQTLIEERAESILEVVYIQYRKKIIVDLYV